MSRSDLLELTCSRLGCDATVLVAPARSRDGYKLTNPELQGWEEIVICPPPCNVPALHFCPDCAHAERERLKKS